MGCCQAPLFRLSVGRPVSFRKPQQMVRDFVKSVASILLPALLASCASASTDAISRAPLLDPAGAEMTAQAPAIYRVSFETSRGEFVVEANRSWAPNGADRFFNLVRHGFYDGASFFRVVSGFIVQFGIPADPGLSSIWSGQTIADDPVRESNRRGSLSFASRGSNTRTTQLFVNLADNERLDRQGFAPFARVVEGMEVVVDSLYSGYGDSSGFSPGPDQTRIEAEGNEYLQREFPRLDMIRTARVLPD